MKIVEKMKFKKMKFNRMKFLKKKINFSKTNEIYEKKYFFLIYMNFLKKMKFKFKKSKDIKYFIIHQNLKNYMFYLSVLKNRLHGKKIKSNFLA